MSHCLIAVDQREQCSGCEGAEDHLQPDLVGERREPDQERAKAARTRICTVVSCRRLSTRETLIECSTPTIASPTRRTTSAKIVNRISVPAVLLEPLPEKNTDSKMIAPKSAIEAAAITSWPKLEPMLPESLSTGTITPREV